MTRLDDELDADEALILGQARRGLGPTNTDEQRLLQNLRVQIALGPSGQLSEAPKSPWPWRIAGTLGVIGAVALSGGLGYQKGLKAGIAQQNQARLLANALPVGSALPAQPNPELTVPAAPERVSPSIAKSLPAPSAARARSEASAPSAAPSAAPAPAALGLDEEVRQLRRVERAIRESNPRLALVLLAELKREIPKGQLLEERCAAGILADCQLGADAAVARARAFVEKHAGSAYTTRVIEICGLESKRNSLPPGTDRPR